VLLLNGLTLNGLTLNGLTLNGCFPLCMASNPRSKAEHYPVKKMIYLENSRLPAEGTVRASIVSLGIATLGSSKFPCVGIQPSKGTNGISVTGARSNSWSSGRNGVW